MKSFENKNWNNKNEMRMSLPVDINSGSSYSIVDFRTNVLGVMFTTKYTWWKGFVSAIEAMVNLMGDNIYKVSESDVHAY